MNYEVDSQVMLPEKETTDYLCARFDEFVESLPFWQQLLLRLVKRTVYLFIEKELKQIPIQMTFQTVEHQVVDDTAEVQKALADAIKKII